MSLVLCVPGHRAEDVGDQPHSEYECQLPSFHTCRHEMGDSGSYFHAQNGAEIASVQKGGGWVANDSGILTKDN